MSIIGLGLMGGSLGRALRSLPQPPRIVGWSASEEDREGATASGAFDDVPVDRAPALAEADLVVLAVPLSAGLALLPVVGDEAPGTATITDVISLKVPLAEAARGAGLGARWVGSHPMTGGEASGFGASRSDLYDGAPVWTVSNAEAEGREDAVHGFWRSLGARPASIPGEEHDRLMGLVSHLPQLASTALAVVLADRGIDPDLLGPGGRDTTRLAASSPRMWVELLRHASPELVGALRALSDECAGLAELIESDDLDPIAEAMRRTRRWRAGR